ncbi:hypothetical protein Goari_023598 [Gossypium aridum]|uniref:DUF4283 domain-containing protein n=1 Tax=Gossypium aridum TaxID=34290 RepID=A0A7J8X4E7_GOSAI|nr:hypothetical protein [Gossypium aridum]
MYNNSRGQFARLAVYIDLGKSLVSKVKIDEKIHMEYESMPLVCFDCGRFRHTRDTCSYRSRQREAANGNLGRETLALMVKTKDNNNGCVVEGSRTLRVKFVGKEYLAWEKLSVVPQIRYKVIEKGVSMNKGKGVAITNRPRESSTILKGDPSSLLVVLAIDDLIHRLSQEGGEDVAKAGAMEAVTPLPSSVVRLKLQSATFKVETEHIQFTSITSNKHGISS